MEKEEVKELVSEFVSSPAIEGLAIKVFGMLGGLIIMAMTALGISSDMKEQSVAGVCAGAQAKIAADAALPGETDGETEAPSEEPDSEGAPKPDVGE